MIKLTDDITLNDKDITFLKYQIADICKCKLELELKHDANLFDEQLHIKIIARDPYERYLHDELIPLAKFNHFDKFGAMQFLNLMIINAHLDYIRHKVRGEFSEYVNMENGAK